MLLRRNRKVGPVVIATVDRSAAKLDYQSRYQELFARAVELPHVASPDLAERARGEGCGRHRQQRRAEVRGEAAPAYKSIVAGAAARSDEASEGRSCVPLERVATTVQHPLQPPEQQQRHGFMFHGDMHRFDSGARMAMRDILNLLTTLLAPTAPKAMSPQAAASYTAAATHIELPHPTLSNAATSPHVASLHATSMEHRMLSRGFQAHMPTVDATSGRAVANPGHLSFRALSINTSRAMLRASICFAPQGDIMSSRRPFDVSGSRIDLSASTPSLL